MAGLITVADLVASPGFEDIDSGQAETLIKRASSFVRLAARGALDDVEAPDAPDVVETIVVEMIRRGWRNPLGHNQEQLGDYGYSNPAPANLNLTARERRQVRQAVGALGMGSVNMESDLPRQPSETFEGDPLL